MTERRPRAMQRRQFLKAGGGIAVFGGLFLVVGCGSDDDDDTLPPGSALQTAAARGQANAAPTPTPVPRATTGPLYDRLGKRAGIEAVVNAFLPTAALDARISSFFTNVNAGRLQTLLVEQICSLSGGPETYTGRDMKTTHATMKVQKAHFDALIEDLGKAMTSQQVGDKERAELLAILNPMASDIVTA